MENEKRSEFIASHILDIIKYSPSENADVFFFSADMPDFSVLEHTVRNLQENILVVLPFFTVIPDSILKNTPDDYTLLNFSVFSGDSDFYVKKSKRNVLCFADVRLFQEDRFWRFAEHMKFTRIFVLFANCASLHEYGYRQSFSLIGEFRASHRQDIQLCAFFNQIPEKTDDFSAIFYSRNTISVNTLSQTLPTEFEERIGTREKYVFLSSILRCEPLTKTAVVFATRRELYEFVRQLKMPVDELSIIHGGLSYEEFSKSLNDFYAGRTKILLATKAVFASTVFIRSEKVYCCSVPFSLSHLYSLHSLLDKPDKKLSCVYCKDDVLHLIRLTMGTAEYMDIEEKDEFINKRLGCLNEIIKNIRKEKVK